MDIQIAVKNIEFSFDNDQTYQSVQRIAEKTASELYQEEQEFQKEECETMLADGVVSDYKEYCDAVGISASDVDYRKPFSENRSHPQIQKQIEELTNKYMLNVLDLPKDVVMSINAAEFNSKGEPKEAAVRAALRSKFGIDVAVAGYESATTAEKKDILSQNAYEKVGEMIKSNDFQSYLDLRASLNKYSSSNVSLIYAQKPDAKAVMGFNAWKKLDRQVVAGAKGIAIWQPCRRQLKTEEQVDEYIKKNSSHYGKPDSKRAVKAKDKMMAEINANGVAEVGMGFRLGTVFDVHQTVPNNRLHDNLMDVVNLNKPLSKDLENYDAVVASMKDAATLVPFAIPQNMSEQDGLFEAVTAYADRLLANAPDKVSGIKSPEPLKGDMHTVETVMSAYLICAHIGIECAEKAGLRLAEIFNNKKLTEQSVMVGKREMFLKSFDRACCVSDQFNKAFDKSFGYDLEARREAAVKEAEERRAKDDALRANRVNFGNTLMQKHDAWSNDDGAKYLVAQSEDDGGYYVRGFPQQGIIITVRDNKGNIERFDAPPSRETVEKLVSEQMMARKAKSKKADDREM